MDLNYDNDWYRYFGDSTIHTVGRHGYVVRMPCDSKPGEKDREPDGSEGKDSGGLESDNGRDNDRKEKEDEMTNGWRLTIGKRWRELTFRFETLVEAGEFVNTFSRHIEPDEDEDENDAKYPWRYSIEPIMEKEEEKDDKD